MRLNIIGTRKIWFAISGAMMVASVVAILVWGLRLGIDFTGGSLLQMRVAGERPAPNEIHDRLQPLELGSITIQPAGTDEVLIRIQESSSEAHTRVIDTLKTAFPAEDGTSRFTELSYVTVGPTIGNELRQRSFIAVGLVLAAIVAYISFVFRKVSRPVSSWKYGVTAILALLHDVLIPTGIVAYLGVYGNFEVDVLFVTAILTVLGFSIHDTIVVFDRIRENLRRMSGVDFATLVNTSLNETLVRSINTSMTALLVLAAVYLFGGDSIKNFVLVLLIGIGVGTYSSIFIASPLLVEWQLRNRSK